MDELELRRRTLADPRSADPDFRRELAAHPAMQQAAAQALHLEQALGFALQQPAVPQGLDDRVLLRVALRQSRRRRRSALYALAASVLVAMGSLLWLAPQPQDGFASMALAHVYDEIDHLEHLPASSVTDARLSGLMQRVGAELQGSLEAVRFAFICPTPQGPGLHLIAEGPDGPVTILYVPGAHVAAAEQRFADERFSGLARALPEGGALALIGPSDAALRALDERLREQVRWKGRAA